MRSLLLLFIAAVNLLEAKVYPKILNESAKPMLCSVAYYDTYHKEKLHGIEQDIQVQAGQRFSQVVEPNESFQITRESMVSCYNEDLKVSWFKKGDLRVADKYALQEHINRHEQFDIAAYANQDKAYVDERFGKARLCQPYQGGRYCNQTEGLDILYNAQDRIIKLFIYGQALKGGKLEFKQSSFHEIYSGDEALGLWVRQKNAKLISKEPILKTSNVIAWKNPSKYIKQLVMSAKDGHIFMSGDAKLLEREKDLLQAIEVVYKLDDTAYANRVKIPPKEDNEEKEKEKEDEDIKLPIRVSKTWGDYLNPKKRVPKNKFRAFYISTQKPRKVLESHELKKIDIDNRSYKYYNILPEELGAYWVGEFEFKEPSLQRIHIQQGGKVRLIIDGMLVLQGSGTKELLHHFEKGVHRVEIEYLNNWHRTKFIFSMKPRRKLYTTVQLQKVLKKYVTPQSDLIYAGTYESELKEEKVRVRISKHPRPVVLFLGSYHKVDWVIDNPYDVPIEAVVFASVREESKVIGDIKKSTPVFRFEERFFEYGLEKKCRCISGGIFRCNGENGLDTVEAIEKIMDKRLYAFSGKYRVENFFVPEIIIDDAQRARLKKDILGVAKEKKACQDRNKEFGKIFN